MTDVFSTTKRSEIMSRIHSQDTEPELVIRRALHSLGYRYNLHDKRLPGCPDIALPKYRSVIQVRGCFWHLHECKRGRLPKSNLKYWDKKLSSNVTRDHENDRLLNEMGWNVIVVWECETRGHEKLLHTIERIESELQHNLSSR